MSIQSTATAPAYGAAPVSEDLGPLAWVSGEVHKSIDTAVKSLRRVSREFGMAADDAAGVLRIARQQLHQAVGVLHMVGQAGPARVLETMERAVRRFVEEPVRCNEDAVSRIEQAGFAITDFLNAVLAGKAVAPVALFPQYRAVFEGLGNERVHPADLWPYRWVWAEVQRPQSRRTMIYDPAVRATFDRDILQVVKSGDETAARHLSEVCAGLGLGVSQPKVASFWMLAAGFFEALSLGLLTLDSYAKLGASRVLLQYTTLSRGDNTVSDRLGQDLLFFCAHAVPPAQGGSAPLLRAVRSAWGVAEREAASYSAPQFGRFDPAVMALARKRIESAKAMWTTLSGGDAQQARQVADSFVHLGESLLKLHPPSAPMVQALSRAADASVRSGQPPSTELAMEVATSILYLEAAFEDLDPQDRQLTARTVQLAGRIDRAREGGRPEPLEAWMEELYRRVSDRQSMGSIVDELRAHLAELEKSLDQFFRRPADKALLQDVPRQLQQMRGVFSVLGLDQALLAVQRMRDSVDALMAPEGASAASTHEVLGNNLGALGFLVDMLGYQPALARRLFVFDAEAGELKPLMGRQTESAGESAAQGAASAGADASGPSAVAAPRRVVSVEEIDKEIAARLAALAANKAAPAVDAGGRRKPTPTTHSAMPDTEVTELGEDDLLAIFLEEAREVTQTGLAAVAALEKDPADNAELTVLRRAFHTLKGSSRMVGLNDFGTAAWAYEQVLNTWLADQRPATPEMLAGTAQALRDFSQWVEAVARNEAHGWQSGPLCQAAEALAQGQIQVEAPPVAAAPAPSQPPAQTPAAPAEAEAPPAPLAMPDLDFDLELDGGQPAPAPAAQPRTEADFDFELDAPAEADADTRAPRQGGAPVDADAIDFDSFDFLQDAPAGPAPAEAAPLDFTLPADWTDEAAPAEADAARLDAEPAPTAAPPEAPQAGAPHAGDAEDDFLAEFVDAPADAAQADVEPADEDATEGTAAEADAVKVVGPLRIGIALYNVYLNEADVLSRQLAHDLGEWALQPAEPIAGSTVALAHSLAGSSATVGFHGLADLARLCESALQQLQRGGHGTVQQGVALMAAADEARRLLHQFAAGFLKEPDEQVMQSMRDLVRAPAGAQAAPGVEAAAQAAERPPAAPAVAPPVRLVAAALDDSDEAIDLSDAIDPELFPVFEEEAADLLPQIAAALRQWQAHPAEAAPRTAALRALHTLKGSARLAGAMRLGERAHRMESAIEAIAVDAGQRSAIEDLSRRLDTLQNTFDDLREAEAANLADPLDAAEPTAAATAAERQALAPPAEAAPGAAPTAQPAVAPYAVPDAGAPHPAPAETLAPLPAPAVLRAGPGPARPAQGQTVRVRTQLLDRLLSQAGEVIITRAQLEAALQQLKGSLTELTGNLDRLRQQLRDVELQAETQMQSRLAQTKDAQQNFDPLEFDRFTRVQELTRMMAESVNDVATVQRTLQGTVQTTEDGLAAQARQTRELQRGLLRTRMMEFESISDRLYRVVRQAAKETGKQVRLDITGGTIEMDRGVLDRMTPAFEHLLRNCVAHGVEPMAARTQAGKDATGLVTVALTQEGNDVSVSFRDDGAGLDRARILARARAAGLLPAGHGDELSVEEAAALVFRPGFTTVCQVSELAGRGIGMDVVRSEVVALGGRIETRSAEGVGTEFKLVLPLTTAVTHVLMVRAGEQIVGVPSNLIELVQRATAEELDAAYASQHYTYGGEDVPFYWTGALLQASARGGQAAGRTNTVVVVRSAAQRLAIHVDDVLGNEEVVVKNLGPQLARLPGLAGISVLPSGAVVLIYNPVALAALHGDAARALQAQAGASAGSSAGPGARTPHKPAQSRVPQAPLVLVVDDSITVRRVTQRLLQREGYRVALATDGLQALERLHEERPAVVLSDIEMPRMDGFDLVRNIRADAALQGLPIVMITSRIAEKHREHAMQLGADHYLGKPFSEEQLLALVRDYATAQPA